MFLPFVIAWLTTKINRHQAHVIAYLREENRILKAKLKGKRLQLTDVERRRLAVLAHPIDTSITTADTLQRWDRSRLGWFSHQAFPHLHTILFQEVGQSLPSKFA